MFNLSFLTPIWLLTLIPVFGLLFWLSRNHSSSGLIATHIAHKLGIAEQSNKKYSLILLSLTWLITILALAGPSIQKTSRPTIETDTARMLIIDMSRSLYAQDIQPNRLTQLKYKALDLLPYWVEGSTGLIAYAGDAYTISPLTSDSATLANLISNLSPDIMPYQGSDAGKAVRLAIDNLQQAGQNRGDLVLIADDLDNAEVTDIQAQLENTLWTLSILAVGTEVGAPIPLPDGSLLTNETGSTVVAKTSMQNMQTISHTFSGAFAPIQTDNSDVELIAKLTTKANLTETKQGNHQIEERLNSGYWLVLFLLIPGLILFRKGIVFVFLLGFIALPPSFSVEASPWLTNDQQAHQQFESKEYQQALEQFDDLQWKAAAAYEAGDYEQTISLLKNSPQLDSQYNLGNAYAQSGQFEEAIKTYENVLKVDADFVDAQTNLDIVRQAQQQSTEQQSAEQQSAEQQSAEQQSAEQQSAEQQSAEQQSAEQQSAEQQSAEQQSAEQQSAEQQNAEQQSAEQQNAEQQSAEQQNAPDSKTEPTPSGSSLEKDNSQAVDPELRKLEQVENARDPSQLIRAQMILQAREKQVPQDKGKSW